MKSMKGRILKKLKSIPQVNYLKNTPILHFNDPSSPLESNLMRDFDNHKENINPIQSKAVDFDKNKESFKDPFARIEAFDGNKEKIRAIDQSQYRKPDPNSATLFDPDLLAAFRQAVMDYIRDIDEARIQKEPPLKSSGTSINNEEDPLLEFEEKTPPDGKESIVLYTTSLGGIRKTFEDCNSIRLLLENLKLVFIERDLAMHVDFREELWKVLGFRAIPPRLFIKGRYIGGADEVLGLHEQGKLLPLVEGVERNRGRIDLCEGCGGIRFRVCFECNGGRKVYVEEKEMNEKCLRCNENGLVVCDICC